MRTAKTMIKLGGCPGGSESSLGAQVILLVLSCGGSRVMHFLPSNSIRDHVKKSFPVVTDNAGLNEYFVKNLPFLLSN